MNGCLSYGLWVGILAISFYNEALNPRSVSTVSLLWSLLRGFSNNLPYIALPALALSLLRIKSRQVRFLWVWGLTILAVSIIGNIAADFLFHPRHIVGLLPVFTTLIAIGLVELGKRTSDLIAWIPIAIWVIAGIFLGLSTDFMNNIPQHIDAVPLSAMITIVDTAETCGTENDTFILSWNTFDEEWVQDQIVGYYFSGLPVRRVTLSRLMDESDERQQTGLMPEDVFTDSVDVRYDYFTANADRVFLFSLPDIPVQDSLNDLENRFENDGFTRCEFLTRDDLTGVIFTRDNDTCDMLSTTCGN